MASREVGGEKDDKTRAGEKGRHVKNGERIDSWYLLYDMWKPGPAE